MDATELITAIVAIYGAGLSTFIFIKQNQKEKRKLNVILKNGFLTQGPELSELMILFDISNPGYVPVTVHPPAISVKGHTVNVLFTEPKSNVNFPYTLQSGKRVHIWEPMKPLLNEFKRRGLKGTIKLIGTIEDQTGKEFKSIIITASKYNKHLKNIYTEDGGFNCPECGYKMYAVKDSFICSGSEKSKGKVFRSCMIHFEVTEGISR